MRVLVTGGSGVIGEGLIPHFLEGHHVRLLTRGADEARASGRTPSRRAREMSPARGNSQGW